jgi:hypothetical protein
MAEYIVHAYFTGKDRHLEGDKGWNFKTPVFKAGVPRRG